jgi:hypothetical protein
MLHGIIKVKLVLCLYNFLIWTKVILFDIVLLQTIFLVQCLWVKYIVKILEQNCSYYLQAIVNFSKKLKSLIVDIVWSCEVLDWSKCHPLECNSNVTCSSDEQKQIVLNEHGKNCKSFNLTDTNFGPNIYYHYQNNFKPKIFVGF